MDLPDFLILSSTIKAGPEEGDTDGFQHKAREAIFLQEFSNRLDALRADLREKGYKELVLGTTPDNRLPSHLHRRNNQVFAFPRVRERGQVSLWPAIVRRFGMLEGSGGATSDHASLPVDIPHIFQRKYTL